MLLAVFIAGLMIGRTPEYLGKKIDVREMKLTALAILVTPALVLLGTALALMTEAGRSGIFNPGIHGFSEVLYAVSSAANNNGSAFAGLSANSPFWNCLLAFCMFVGRFGIIVPVLAIAGSLVNKKNPTDHHRDITDPRRAVYRPADGHRVTGRRPDLYPRPRVRPGRGIPLFTLILRRNCHES